MGEKTAEGRGLKLFVDNNLSPQIARAFTILGVPSIHLTDHFRPDTSDSDWIPWTVQHDYTVLTRDKNIKNEPGELETWIRHGARGFLAGGTNLSRWRIIGTIFSNLDLMQKVNGICPAPFLIRVPAGKVGAQWDNLLEAVLGHVDYPETITPPIVSRAQLQERKERKHQEYLARQARRVAEAGVVAPSDRTQDTREDSSSRLGAQSQDD